MPVIWSIMDLWNILLQLFDMINYLNRGISITKHLYIRHNACIGSHSPCTVQLSSVYTCCEKPPATKGFDLLLPWIEAIAWPCATRRMLCTILNGSFQVHAYHSCFNWMVPLMCVPIIHVTHKFPPSPKLNNP